MRETQGADVLARRVMRTINEKTVVDSIRNPQEVAYLRQQDDFILLAIDAPVETRLERVKQRGREESASTLQEFIAKETEEMSNHQTGQQLGNCIQLADFKIENDSTLEDLYKKLETFV
jgi:dephospho-CoA kinase